MAGDRVVVLRSNDPREPRLAIVDHLVGRVVLDRNGEITTSLVDIVDRLHGELASERAGLTAPSAMVVIRGRKKSKRTNRMRERA